MQYAIVTPTYSGHFRFIKKYLESFREFVVDKNEIQIYFTINKDEKKDFDQIIEPYQNDCNIKVIFFDDLLEANEIRYSPDVLLRRLGTYSFQTLKKLYTISSIDYEWCLILDSESMWVRPTEMCKLFEQYIKDPYVVGSDIAKRKIQSRLFHQVIENVEYLLDCHFGKWYIETFSWFYNKKIVESLLEEYGTPYEMAEKIYAFERKYGIEPPVGIMEGPLFYTYLYKNKEKFHYRFIDILAECEKWLGDEKCNQYLEHFYKTYEGHAGIVEYAPMLLSKENVVLLGELFEKNEFNIIRCEYTDLSNYKLQKEFISIANPYILAVSQNHWFGLNAGKRKIYWQVIYRAIRSVMKKTYHFVKDNVKEVRRRFSFTFKMTCLINNKIDFLINEGRYHYDSTRERLIKLQREELTLICELIRIAHGEKPTISLEELENLKQEMERYSINNGWKYSN